MKETNIRPVDIMLENEKLHTEDVENILTKKSNFIFVSCPACSLNKNKKVFSKKGFDFYECLKCKTLFINSRPSFEVLSDFYTNSKSIQHWNDKIFPASEGARRQNIFSPRAKKVVELCKKYATDTDNLYDVGAGFGTFCEEIKKLKTFQKVIAIEPSRSLAKTCRDKGIEVIEKTIEDADLQGGANVITNFELIEHLFDPEDFIKSCHKALVFGGLFIMTTPNIKGFDLMTLGSISNNIVGPNHLNYFHPTSITKLLARCGFEVLEILTPGKLDAELVRNKILSEEFDVSSQAFLKHILIDEWEKLGEKFQEFLADNLLSSHMWVVAKKI